VSSCISYFELQTDEDWDELKRFLNSSVNACVTSILDYVRNQGAVSLIVENQYLDRDFTSEFAHFYALVFKRHKKVCRRVHFFGMALRSGPEFFSLIKGLEKAAADQQYLGYIVIRPLENASIGRTVLAVPKPSNSNFPSVLVRGKHETHLLGVELTVEGAPFMQQDARAGACAHVSIWMAARHLHVKHKEGWFSTVDIAERASNPTDTTLASSLPSGSGGLNLNNMIRAIRAMGREPIVYLANEKREADGIKYFWAGNLRPEDIINRYVDSAIPVILGIAPWDTNQREGHAVTCFGHVEVLLPDNSNCESHSTSAIFCNAFLVNDDQRGCYLRMPIRECAEGNTPYSVSGHVFFILIPLPSRVFIKAEVAETIAWNLVSNLAQNWPDLEEHCKCQIYNVTNYIEAFREKKLIARTYLTYGWKYKRRIKDNIISEEAKTILLNHELPRFVWTIEFGYFDSLNDAHPENRRIVSHVVVDATTGQYWSSGKLIFHAPGFIFEWSHDRLDETGPYEARTWVIHDERPYFPRIRGSRHPSNESSR
jgi:hypothetical protein